MVIFPAIVVVSADNIAVLVLGSAMMNLGLGVFSAVDQAIVLATLPHRAEAGRFLGIMHYAQQIPHAIAPLAASVVLAIGAEEGQQNYAALYLTGGAFTLAGGLIIAFRVKGAR